MHCLHIEAKEVCIINRAQKIERQSTKCVLNEKKKKLRGRAAQPPDLFCATTESSMESDGRSLSHFYRAVTQPQRTSFQRLPLQQRAQEGAQKRSTWSVSGAKLPLSSKHTSDPLSRLSVSATFPNNGQLSLGRQRKEAAGIHSSSADGAPWAHSPTSGRNSFLCHQQGAPSRGSLAYGVCNFFSDKWRVSRTAEEQEERRLANHSPLPAPSGRIILLYADELITVSSIWLLYKKVPAPHTVSTAARGPTTLQRQCITI